ncbi:AAA family ATPase [Mesorhizobium sp. M0904]|uniref:AAA family ATPase n=1 Tax=unclassified Mesorhizobium TaxID=325217 RepID=UPI00333A2544
MLLLKKLEIEGFGPFADKQVLLFPAKPGVLVVYGENMRGKTTLLNAIRYAFFGKVLGRGRRERLVHSLSNRERASAGKFGFNVALEFEFDGQAFELYRGHEARGPSPINDGDYRSEVLLRRGGQVVSQQEQDRLLGQIFPEDISRFFLFDGELLQEYEELIINESEVGPQISSAIERILGVPILKAGRRHLLGLADEADRQAATEASRHQETQSLGNALQAAITLRKAQQDELVRLKDNLADLTRQKGEIDAKLAADRRAADLMNRRQDALNRAAAAATRQVDLRLDIKRAMSDAWRTVLHEPIRKAREQAQINLQSQIEALKVELRRAAVERSHCDICEQDVAPALRSRLLATLGDTGAARPADQASIRLGAVGGFRDFDVSGEVRQLVRQIQDMAVVEQHEREEAKDLLSSLADTDQASVRSTQATYVEVIEQIAIVKQGIEKQAAQLEQQETRVDGLRRKLQNTARADVMAVEARAKLLRDSAAVFDDAVEAYKTELRKRVEASATELFLAMTTEKTDFAGLRINNDYGLTIIHRDGRPEDARSAGAEHVVALALMGALQQNAPLRGPIVMDSPFGRLDDGHTSNVVSGLHKMADQVVLLVYEAEVGRQRARELLGSRLVAEYELERVNSRRTNIREIR